MDRSMIHIAQYRARRKFLFLNPAVKAAIEMDDKSIFRVADTNVFTVDDGFSIYYSCYNSVSADEFRWQSQVRYLKLEH
jgi:hypothetical protein